MYVCKYVCIFICIYIYIYIYLYTYDIYIRIKTSIYIYIHVYKHTNGTNRRPHPHRTWPNHDSYDTTNSWRTWHTGGRRLHCDGTNRRPGRSRASGRNAQASLRNRVSHVHCSFPAPRCSAFFPWRQDNISNVYRAPFIHICMCISTALCRLVQNISWRSEFLRELIYKRRKKERMLCLMICLQYKIPLIFHTMCGRIFLNVDMLCVETLCFLDCKEL